jgi:SAM-dependent methyltransferase
MISYNRVCNIGDFADEALRDIIREVFAHELPLFPPEYPDGVADSKQWEIAMAVRALRDFDALQPGARLLGIGAGTEATTFFLSRHVRQVVATDIYAGAGPWADVAPSGFLVEPRLFAGDIPCSQRHILPLHQDARALDLPDEEFDGVFSSGSIEHFGSLPFVANAAYEIGRVLKPGGVAAIATEFKVAGPPDGDGWDPWVILFSPEKLQRWIVEASGLEPVDALHKTLSDATLSVRRDLLSFLDSAKQVTHPAQKIGVYPNLILYHEGYLFCSVHLTLRKPVSGWGRANGWAAPDAVTREAVAAGRRAAVAALAAPAGQSVAQFFLSNDMVRRQLAQRIEVLEQHCERLQVDGDNLRLDNKMLRSENDRLRAHVSALHGSTSWRITKPLRSATLALRGR